MKRLHLVYGESGAGVLRQALCDLSREDSVVAFPSVLEYAELFADFSEEAVKAYAERCCALLMTVGGADEELAQKIMTYLATDFSAYDEVVVWRGDGVGDRLFYDLTCAAVGRELSVVDLSPLRDMLSNKSVKSLSMGICSVDNAKALYENISALSAEEKSLAVEQWRRWSQSRSALRLLSDSGDIVEAEQDVFDELILFACGEEWQAAPRIVGRLLCQIDFAVGDSFIHQRFVALAQRGELSVRPSQRLVGCGECAIQLFAPSVKVDGVEMGELRLFELRKS